MAKNKLQTALESVSASDLRVDAQGRIAIDNPDLAQALDQSAASVDALKRRGDDLNIICCGNGQCGQKGQESLLENMVRTNLPSS